jgi:hypothetical protein
MPPETRGDLKEKSSKRKPALASAEPGAEPSAGPSAEPSASPKPSPRREYLPKKRLLALVLILSIAGLVGAYLPYQSYAAVWRRPIARVPRCVLAARMVLRKPSVVSGSEPSINAAQETVYLTPQEARTVRCIQRVSEPLAGRFAGAFTEIEPERRAIELLKVLRDVPKDQARDREASTAYFIASGALRALPELPETKAATEELEELHNCRFVTKSPCAARPPIPMIVWIAGVPSALGVLAVLGMGARAGVLRLVDFFRERRARKKARA